VSRPRRMIHYQKRPAAPRFNLNPELNNGIIAVLLFILAGIATLSFFQMAGVLGQFVDSFLALLFGQVRYCVPLVLITASILLVKDIEYNYRHTHSVGAILFFLSFNGLVHLQYPLADMASTAQQGYGGGMIGFALAWVMASYVGYWGGMLILIGLLIVSLIFLFNTTLAQMVEIHKKLFLTLGWLGREIVAFFGSFKNPSSPWATPGKPVKFAIKGDYENQTQPEDNINETDGEEERVFKQKSIAQTDDTDETEEEPAEAEPEEEKVVGVPQAVIRDLPNLDLLFTSKSKPSAGDIKGNAETIKSTLKNFGIEVEMGEVRVGPTVTQYSFKPAAGIKLTRITTLSNDLALALAAHPIRIEAPIPGQSLVGVEVPNQKVAMVTLRELLESEEFTKRPHNMMIALGKDVAGKVWWTDLLKMPHLLVAGATGSGKTVCINAIITSLLYQNTAETLRFIMVDPKRVELTLYDGIPHLLTPAITTPAKCVNALKWTINEMERRFDVLAKAGKRDIASFNKSSSEPLPYIVFVIDELADLMSQASAEVEAGIIRIAQMARAVGIHLIVATQRPSVEVITGLMKANIPGRIAFSVASIIDSRTILDCPGAEKLLGRGDMLLLTADMSKPKRVQGAFISEEEIDHVVEHLKGDEPPTYDDAIVAKGDNSGGTLNMFTGGTDDQDALFDDAKRCVIESGKASASLLQRRLKVGYARAARLLDELENAGIVGPADGAKPREVFTEHIGNGHHMPAPEAEIPADEQTMDLGGVVLDDNKPKESEAEEEPPTQ